MSPDRVASFNKYMDDTGFRFVPLNDVGKNFGKLMDKAKLYRVPPKGGKTSEGMKRPLEASPNISNSSPVQPQVQPKQVEKPSNREDSREVIMDLFQKLKKIV